MKISNTVNGDLKEQMQKINDTVSKLQIFYDEQTEVMDAFETTENPKELTASLFLFRDDADSLDDSV